MGAAQEHGPSGVLSQLCPGKAVLAAAKASRGSFCKSSVQCSCHVAEAHVCVHMGVVSGVQRVQRYEKTDPKKIEDTRPLRAQ